MRKLAVIPSQSGYAAELGDETLRAQLEGGPSRTRRGFIGAVAAVNATWNLPQSGYNYLMAFYRTGTAKGSEPFLVDLILDTANVLEYQAKFISPPRLAGVRGLTHNITAQLEVKPLAVDADSDNSIMDTYEAYGDEGGNVLMALAKLVNVTAPNALPG